MCPRGLLLGAVLVFQCGFGLCGRHATHMGKSNKKAKTVSSQASTVALPDSIVLRGPPVRLILKGLVGSGCGLLLSVNKHATKTALEIVSPNSTGVRNATKVTTLMSICHM